MSKPIAVLTSDIHFNLNTLPLASQALKAALSKAEELQVPLVIAGDLHDTKAIIRAEVMNALIEILEPANIDVFILRGNHDQLHEKSEEHGLNYLKPYATIIDSVSWLSRLPEVVFFPYMSNAEFLKTCLSGVMDMPRNEYVGTKPLLIMHQGFLGAAMGDYIQDKTSIAPEVVKDFTVISGHYHKHQTIGTVTYIGSPFTMSFGEANDGPKGFLILNSDGTFTREILNLRRHIKIETDLDNLYLTKHVDNHPEFDDLVWIKVSGSYSQLQKLDKQEIAARLMIQNFKLDLIPIDSKPTDIQVENLSSGEVFDKLIDNTSESDEQKIKLKATWKELI